MNRRAYRRQWLRLKDKYEFRAARIFRKHLKQAALTIPFDKLTPNTYKPYIFYAIPEEAIKKAFSDTYIQIGLAHGRRVGQGINAEIRKEKNFTPISFEPLFVQFIQNWLLSQGGQRIVSVQQSVAEYIIEFIAKSLDQGMDIRTIARELEKHIRSRGFYRWQIERIVRTETTAAANMAATMAGEDSGLVMEKEWISSNDARTRQREKGDQFDHLDMNGVRVGEDDLFELKGVTKFGPVTDYIKFPGDPDGHPGNIINCRCTVALVPKRNENGRLVFRDRGNAPVRVRVIA